ncbi:TadE/TadG family type IV pilus assembly protein [Pseudogemmobacter sp. W21_MBD1_M6]|uniref:TadE/TadG family type IV pilus assembly protein n=1 Tax=Pseudogemmobacter sp. W21_MBD1_M6 TaxID=3240271 RepID=UPI003F970EDF
MSMRSAGFARSERGGVMVEFAIVCAVFFLLLFALLDFGRLAFSNVLAEKSASIAARIAAVRPPACAGVPVRYTRGTADPQPRFGTSCRAFPGTCATVATVTCAGAATNATATEIWARIASSLPAGSAIGNMQFSYSFDANLGFLGGPYTPMVTVDLHLPDFEFVSPLGGLAGAAGAADTAGMGADIIRPTFSVSMPAEDLAAGEAG